MPIQVTCPGCLKRFQVNDKFAGKTGPCPSCSKPITIPAKADEVVIHAPEGASPKDSKGRPVFKPLRRQEVKLSLPVILAAVAVSVVSIGVALIVRFSMPEPPTALLALGCIALAPPLVLVGYWFLHDDELEGFTGQELIVRCAIVSAIFMITWALYAFVPMYVGGYKQMGEIDMMSVMLTVPVMLAIGSITAVLALELEIMQGFMHYALYFAVTVFLALLMGAPLAEPFARSQPKPAGSPLPAGAPATKTPASPAAKTPTPTPTAPTPTAPTPTDPNADRKPRLIQ